MPKPRRPKNPDDDEAMDAYNEKLAIYEQEQADKSVKKSTSSKSSNYNFPVASKKDIAAFKLSAKQVALNASNGHCPYNLTHVYVYIASPTDFKKRGHTAFMCRRQSGYESSISPDFKIFEKLCGGEDNFCGEEENLLLDFKGGKDVAAAVDPMLREAVRQKKIKSSDVERLAVKFKSWMKGVNWNKTRMSASNRPSLGSWNGWPWDSYNIMERQCGMASSVAWKPLQIQEGADPLELVPPHIAPQFQLIWTAENGIVDDVDAAIDLSHRIVCDNHKEQVEQSSKEKSKKRASSSKPKGAAKKKKKVQKKKVKKK